MGVACLAKELSEGSQRGLRKAEPTFWSQTPRQTPGRSGWLPERETDFPLSCHLAALTINPMNNGKPPASHPPPLSHLPPQVTIAVRKAIGIWQFSCARITEN